MTERKFEDLSPEAKEDQIFNVLVLEELGAVDSLFAKRYLEAKTSTKDTADRMRLDIAMIEKVVGLRRQGKMKPKEEIRGIAKGMIDMGSDEMRKTVSDFSLKIRSQKTG